MTDATPYTVPKEPGRWRAIALAALVHAALLAFLWIGIRWQSETPIAVEAEVWSPETREAAPLPQPPAAEPEPKPVVKEPPKPEVKEPPVVKPEPPVAKPDIALEQEKKRKAEEKRQEEERLAKKKAEEEKLAKKKEDDERLKQQKEEEEKLAKKKSEEKLRAEKEAQVKKAAAEKKRKEQEAEEKLLAKARDEEMRRITGGVTGSGGAGDAPKSQGGRGDPSYGQRVGAKIRSNINFNVPDGMVGNTAVEFDVNLLPDGSIASIRKIKSSGVPGFDEAVSRAIEKSQPYPKDKSGAVPSNFIGVHRPKDQ